MLDSKNLFELAKVTGRAALKPATNFSYADSQFTYSELNETLRKELREYAGTIALFRENKNTIFTLMETVVDDVLPKRVLELYGQFAEFKQFKQGEKAIFTQKITAQSRRRAKQFITKVGLAGVYEVFKLDGRSFELESMAIGGACQISIEEYLDGRLDFAELLDIVMEALDETIYVEIQKALAASVAELQEANRYTGAGFNEKEMDRLIQVADAYGQSTIYCTYEFAATMVPSKDWVADAHRVERWNNGYLAHYKNHNVVVLPQSYTDETNTKKVVDASIAYIIPTGADKPVKIAFEGQTLVEEFKNHDWSREIRVYKKLGIGTIITNNVCVYRNTELAE